MKILFLENYLKIFIDEIGGFKMPPQDICIAHKLSDIPDDVFDKMTDEQLDQIYYFFWDLETR